MDPIAAIISRPGVCPKIFVSFCWGIKYWCHKGRFAHAGIFKNFRVVVGACVLVLKAVSSFRAVKAGVRITRGECCFSLLHCVCMGFTTSMSYISSSIRLILRWGKSPLVHSALIKVCPVLFRPFLYWDFNLFLQLTSVSFTLLHSFDELLLLLFR